MTNSARKRLATAFVLMLTPFLLLFWVAWYHHTYNPDATPPTNYTALTSLRKPGICEDNIVNDHIPLCAEITDYCKTAGKSNAECKTWLSTTRIYFYFFWVSVATILILFMIGAAIFVVTLKPIYARRL